MAPTTARLFFALWPDEAMQTALAAAVAAIVRDCDGRAVPAGNFHLTLAFLGSVPHSRFEAVIEAAAQCVQSVSLNHLPIAVMLDSVEYWRKPQILCATGATPPAAEKLADALKSALARHGFSPDLKPFRIHATFARKVRHVTRELHIEPVRWSFGHLHLVESETGAAGAARATTHGEAHAAAHASIYSTVEKWVLDKRDR